jgi:N-carbamoylputrescine amidase
MLIAVAVMSALAGCQGAPANDARIVRVAVCQTLCIDGDVSGNMRRVEHALEEAASEHAQIACFPETVMLGWVNPIAHERAEPIPGPRTEHLAELARKHELMICIGLAEKADDALHDSVVLIGSDGAILARHRKINILTELMDPPYTPGRIEDITAVDTPIGRIGLLICADTFRGELLDRMREQRPELVLVPYGWAAGVDAWPQHGDNLAATVAAAAQRVRCPVVGTDCVGLITHGPWTGMTYGGQSPVADANGTILGVLRDRDREVRCFDIALGAPSQTK